jgi:hypothetical protein
MTTMTDFTFNGPLDNMGLFELPPVADAPSEAVLEVWNYWIETLRERSANKVVLSDKRRKKIEKAIKMYDVETCKKAIRGCASSDFHMGRNGSGTKYDDIELILRDPEKIEKFRDMDNDRNDW